MFYATRTQQLASNVTETQALSFYSKADRAAFLAKDSSAKAVTAADNAKLKTAGTEFMVSDKEIGCTYFSRIVQA